MARKFDPDSPELMDRPQPVSDELRRDLANLQSLNRRFGAHRIARRFLCRHIKTGSTLRVADLCTGAGDIPRLAVDLARAASCDIRVEAVDFQASTVAIASEYSSAYPEITFHVADARSWSPDAPADLVLCSLALHHFTEEDAIKILARCREIARSSVLVADLRRGPITSMGILAATTFLYREPMTVADARESARRAFSFAEMASLAKRAGWADFLHRRRPFGRQELILTHGREEA